MHNKMAKQSTECVIDEPEGCGDRVGTVVGGGEVCEGTGTFAAYASARGM